MFRMRSSGVGSPGEGRDLAGDRLLDEDAEFARFEVSSGVGCCFSDGGVSGFVEFIEASSLR